MRRLTEQAVAFRRREKAPPAADLRLAPVVIVRTPPDPDGGDAPKEPRRWARVEAFSDEGVSLLTACPYGPGQRLLVESRSAPALDPVRVASAEPLGTGGWLVECRFEQPTGVSGGARLPPPVPQGSPRRIQSSDERLHLAGPSGAMLFLTDTQGSLPPPGFTPANAHSSFGDTLEYLTDGVLGTDRAAFKIDPGEFLHLVGVEEKPLFLVGFLALALDGELDTVGVTVLVNHLPLPGMLLVLYRAIRLHFGSVSARRLVADSRQDGRRNLCGRRNAATAYPSTG
jgi:hypothetical protein